MKIKHAILLLILGYCLDLIAAFLKLTHAPNATMVLIVGAILKVAGGLLLLYKILTYPKFRDFLNW